MLYTYRTTGADILAQKLPPATYKNRVEVWAMGCSSIYSHISQTETVQLKHLHTDHHPPHSLTLSFTLTSPLFLTHSHPTRPAPPASPQLQEIPNDLHHQCAYCISCQEQACVRTHATNTHTKHINEQSAKHKPYVQTNKKADRRTDRQTHAQN